MAKPRSKVMNAQTCGFLFSSPPKRSATTSRITSAGLILATSRSNRSKREVGLRELPSATARTASSPARGMIFSPHRSA